MGGLTTMSPKTQQDVPIVYAIDDDAPLRDGISNLLRSVGIKTETFGSTNDFVRFKRQVTPSCLVLDVRLPGMSGLEFQGELQKLSIHIPIHFLTPPWEVRP
jgi:FixJ family two-component response regulator